LFDEEANTIGCM